MDCNRFEEQLSDFFDGLLAAEEATLFRLHSLQCRECRALMDDVKAAIHVCHQQHAIEPSELLEASLVSIPDDHADLDCGQFENLITEFLDGFVPALDYHRFEEHAERCGECSTLLTGVVYAVAACHSVHTFEEVDVPDPLVARLVALMPETEPALTRRIADAFARFAEQLIPRTTQTKRWTFATATSLGLATFAFLLLGVSDDGTFSGVYRQAHVKASELYTQGTDIYTETDKVVARLEIVGRGIGEFWDTLGGEPKAERKTNTGEKQEPNSNKRVQSAERN
ncbi:MAG TPA: zf-HC2 domain-containing protein [Blastocatellia bacterium]|nr:zf-HC2 domain-containing protein [Blastocatellia bacterium]